MRACIFSLAFVTALLLAAGMARAQRNVGVKATEASDVARGEKTYEKNCAICHFAASPEKKIGPGMKGIMKKEKFSNGWKMNDEDLRRWIEDGGKDMPPSHLNREQIRELIAYVKTL